MQLSGSTLEQVARLWWITKIFSSSILALHKCNPQNPCPYTEKPSWDTFQSLWIFWWITATSTNLCLFNGHSRYHSNYLAKSSWINSIYVLSIQNYTHRHKKENFKNLFGWRRTSSARFLQSSLGQFFSPSFESKKWF